MVTKSINVLFDLIALLIITNLSIVLPQKFQQQPSSTDPIAYPDELINNTWIRSYSHLLDTEFEDIYIVPVAEFNTSEALLTIFDTAVKSKNDSNLYIHRFLINKLYPNVFVAAEFLIVPKNASGLLNTTELSIDYVFLDLYTAILLAPPFGVGSLNNNSHQDVLVIGLGGSQINNFLHNKFPKLNITVIEIQPAIGVIARKYFGFQDDSNQQLLIMDGLKYLNDTAINNDRRFDTIYIDACPSVYPGNESVLCPGHAFLDPRNIQNMKKCLSEKGTLVIKMLLVTENVTEKAQELSKPFVAIFDDCVILPMVSINNKVLVCVVNRLQTPIDPLKIWQTAVGFQPSQAGLLANAAVRNADR